MCVDQHRKHAKGFVFLDEAHAAHVGGQIVNITRALGGSLTILLVVEIQREIFNVPESLVPMIERLDVNSANTLVALRAQGGHEIAADKTTGTGYENEIVMKHMVSPTSVTVTAYCNEFH